jgi:L-cystine transport system substrate-binding protein
MEAIKKKKFITTLLFVSIFSSMMLSGCGSNSNATNVKEAGAAANVKEENKTEAVKVEKIKVAYAQASKPITYLDESGNATGYDVEVLKLVDELLPQYEFDFIPTTDDDLLIGVESGKYDAGVKNVFYTAARAEKYLYPKEYLGASASGLIIRKEDEGKVRDLSDIAKLKKKLLPIAPQDAQYAIVQTYNKANPDNQITLEASESFSVQDGILLVAEGKYDAWLIIKPFYNSLVVADGGAYHNLADKLAWTTFTATKTWPLFNKKKQELADAYDTAIKQLKAEGKTKELLMKFVGEDTFSLLNE